MRKITVWGKTGCKLCSSAKEKLVRLGKEFDSRDIEYMTEPHEGWREDGSIEALAGHALINRQIPMIEIDGWYYNYSGAMKELKKK